MTSWLDPLGALSDALNAWYVGLLKQIINFLFVVTVPSVKDLESQFFALGLGGTYGLALRLFGVMATVVALIVVLSPSRNHSLRIGRLLTSLLGVGLFGYLFYPLYSLLFDLSQGITQAVINLMATSPNATIKQINDLLAGSAQDQVFARLVLSAVASFFALMTLTEAISLRVMLFVILLVYPLVLAARPLGGPTRQLFNACNTALLVVILSPPLMGVFFALPIFVIKILPGGTLPLVGMVTTMACGGLAMIAPILLALIAYKGSSEVFGKLDTSVAGAVDIGNAPPLTVEDVKHDAQDVHMSPLKMIAADYVGDKLAQGNLFDDIKSTAINAVSTVSAAAGHPYIGAAVKAGDHLVTKVKGTASSTSEGGEST